MTERDAGYLQALSDMHCEIWRMAQDTTVSPDGRLELLNILSLVDDRIRQRAASVGDAVDAESANENRIEAQG